MMGGGGSRVGKASRTHTHNTAHSPTNPWLRLRMVGINPTARVAGAGTQAEGGNWGMEAWSALLLLKPSRGLLTRKWGSLSVPRRVLGACSAHAPSLGFPRHNRAFFPCQLASTPGSNPGIAQFGGQRSPGNTCPTRRPKATCQPFPTLPPFLKHCAQKG